MTRDWIASTCCIGCSDLGTLHTFQKQISEGSHPSCNINQKANLQMLIIFHTLKKLYNDQIDS